MEYMPESIAFDNTEDFLFRPPVYSIKRHFTKETFLLLLFLATVFTWFVYFNRNYWHIPLLLMASGSIALSYFALMLFKLRIVLASLTHPFLSVTSHELEILKNEDLPVYTVLIPLRREEAVIGQIMNAMRAIDYPADKLDIIITVEEYDRETRLALSAAHPPSHFRVLVLPDVQPKTKPKALNVAFREAKGTYLVIYDAEIVPDPDQLKKSVIAFRHRPKIACLQTRLEHYNAKANALTRLFNAEFSFYYDLFLPGLQKFGFPIPLSGHSTHFRVDALRAIGAWDPYNVAEDCDMGMMLYRAGYRTDILDSVSREEATADVPAWIRQRTRWMKGFIQTSIVHLRHPLRLMQEVGGIRNFLAFLATVPGTVLINVVNLVYWGFLISWVIFKPPFIQSLFPGPILYMSVLSFILGNFIFTFLNLIGAYQRRQYATVKYCLISPLYWILLALATIRAGVQILTRPHGWEKTTHQSYQPSAQYEFRVG